MNNNISTQDMEKLNFLTQHYHFNELTAEEKKWVLNIVKAEEYNDLRYFYTNIPKTDLHKATIEPSIEIKRRLEKSFDAMSKNNTTAIKISHLYKWTAVIILCLCVGYLIQFVSPFHRQTEHIATNILKDTVQLATYVQSPSAAVIMSVTTKHIQTKTSHNHTVTLANVVIDTIPQLFKNSRTESDNFTKINATQIIQQALKEKNGNSLLGDTVLKEMLVILK